MTGRVMVLADNQESGADLIANVLAPAGYEAVLEREGGPPADVLVLDLTRLRGAPLAGLRARRDAGDNTPAILLAAHLPDELAPEVFRLKVVDFLVKPVRRDSLITSLEAVLAGPTASAREVAQLTADNETLHRRLDDWRSAVSIGRAVVQIHDLDTLLARIVEAATYLTNAEEGALYLIDSVSGELILRASRDANQAQAQGLRLRAPDQIASEVMQSGAPAVRVSSERGPGLKVKTGHLVHALINLPLNIGDRRLGVLGVYHRSRGRTFDDRQIESLSFLADWAAIAVESAQRFSDLQARLEQKTQALSRGRNATGELTESSPAGDLRQPLEVMAEELDRLLAAGYGPLRPAQADCLARLRHQVDQALAAIERSNGVERA